MRKVNLTKNARFQAVYDANVEFGKYFVSQVFWEGVFQPEDKWPLDGTRLSNVTESLESSPD